MILKLEHVVAYRINWRAKPQNVVSLAEELNVGLDAFVFMDDSPVECALIQAELPQARYVPEALSSANVLLVRARNGSGDDTPYRDVYNTGTFGWSDIADRLTVVDVDGGHYTMLEEPFVDSLARALSPYLQRNAPSSVRQLEVT